LPDHFSGLGQKSGGKVLIADPCLFVGQIAVIAAAVAYQKCGLLTPGGGLLFQLEAVLPADLKGSRRSSLRLKLVLISRMRGKTSCSLRSFQPFQPPLVPRPAAAAPSSSAL
jgi:hypothetical protein